MISNISELKELITWAKANKLNRLKIGEIEFELSELNHVESYPDVPGLMTPAESAKIPNGNAEPPEDEQLLYWSTR